MKTLAKRWVAVAVSLLMVLGCCLATINYTNVSANAANGIMNNGLNGIEININEHPYSDYYASLTTVEYTSMGCTWFVMSRATQKTGTYYNAVWSAEHWIDTVAPANGYTVELAENGNMTISPDSVLCYYGNGGTHVAYVERVDGNTVTISEGGQTYSEWYDTRNPADYGYCIIREVSLSEISSTSGTPLKGVVHLTSGGGTPVDPPTPSLTTSWDNYSSFDGLNANFYATISASINVNFTEAGMTVWQDGVQVGQISESTSVSDGYMNMWYSPQELGMALSAGHTYTYQFYAVANGQRYESEVYSYTTPGTTPPSFVTSWQDDSSFDGLNANFYATISASINVNFTEAGMSIWQDGVQVGQASEPTTVSGGYMNLWYSPQELGMALSAGHTYTYQFYAVANGQRYESDVYTYTTPAPEPTQKQNQWTQELSIEDWDFNWPESTPTAEALYGDVVFTYSDSEDGPFTSDVPFYAGTYYVKAEVAETSEYTGLTAVKSFTIHKAEPPFLYPEGLYAYYGQRLEDIELPEGMTWTQESLEQFDGRVGDCMLDRPFSVDYNPGDLDNYVMLYNQLVPVDVLPRDISDLELPEITADTNLEELSLTLDGLELALDRDYTISQQTKEETGEVIVTIEGTGNYTGMVSASYTLPEEPVTPPEKGNDSGVTPDNNDGNSNPTNTGTASGNSATNGTEAESDVPQTGDNTVFSITAIAAVMLLSGCGIVIAVKQRKKSR